MLSVMAIFVMFASADAVCAAEDEELTEDGDAESSESAESELEIQCLRDDDCEAGWICRDIGICVPLDCNKDVDCKVVGFYCREDKVCAPETCVYDRDCQQNEFCDKGVCLTTPGENGYPYVEGGSPNCNSAGTFPAVSVFILLLTALMFVRSRFSAR